MWFCSFCVNWVFLVWRVVLVMVWVVVMFVDIVVKIELVSGISLCLFGEVVIIFCYICIILINCVINIVRLILFFILLNVVVLL